MSGIRTYANHAWDWWRAGRGQHGPECHCLPCADLRAHVGRARLLQMSERAMKQGATRLGISVDDYRRHIEAGERWCSGHQMWEPFWLFGLHVHRGLNSACEESVRFTSRQAMARLRRIRREREAS